ncbi:hypothetical protein RRG08_031901 [Elysia crispata]|uniref:Uncharacterized protein n=1 Tax=Elysia crispata TaxID=231223 RepID=A0AAE1AI49_9GAST|nr:hypothetical protein RRG08_031901 [Elysia crispata]
MALRKPAQSEVLLVFHQAETEARVFQPLLAAEDMRVDWAKTGLYLVLLVVCLSLSQAQVIELNSTECAQWTMWSAWSQVSACVPVCGPGTQTRQRQRPCPDQPGVTQFDVQTFACEAEPVNGGPGEWGEWAETSNCQAYCGRGMAKAVRTRDCDNPAPSCGGRYCDKRDLVDRGYTSCTNFPCGPICPSDFAEYVSQYSPAQGFYILCRRRSGFIRRCPNMGDDWLDLRSASMLGYNDILAVCSGNYRYG